MEKNTPHRKLAVFKDLVGRGQVKATATAYRGALDLGFNNLADMCAVIMSLKTENFFKSMTTIADHRIWQDVYHANAPDGHVIYLKLTVIDDVLIVSFKEL